MKSSKYILITLTLISSSLFLSCKGGDKDMKKNNYVVSKIAPIKSVPKTIVSVSPAITSILFDLDSGDRLIGRTDFCTYPPQVKNIKSIGGINNANLEMIISMQPDLVITSSIFTKKMFETIESSKIPIISFKETNEIEGMYDIIEVLGDILDKKEKASQIISECKTKLREIKTKRQEIKTKKEFRETKKENLKTPKVYYVIGYGQSGDFSAGKDTYINEIITLAGGDNIAKNSVNWSFSREELFAQQPDFIFVRKEDSANFVKTYPYTKLNAVINNKVFGIESELMDLQTPRSLKAIEFISEIISSQF
ncbi:MAG: helical backbone metal receptor [Bacteroidales bacterium]|nr:helical backbone metal receptor [Bacteroidales bacterium]